jgi:hypothetical protein
LGIRNFVRIPTKGSKLLPPSLLHSLGQLGVLVIGEVEKRR